MQLNLCVPHQDERESRKIFSIANVNLRVILFGNQGGNFLQIFTKHLIRLACIRSRFSFGSRLAGLHTWSKNEENADPVNPLGRIVVKDSC